MTPPRYALVWLDSTEARVYRFDAKDIEQQGIQADNPFRKITHKAGIIGAGRPQHDLDYFDRIVDAMRGANEWLLVGSGSAKNELLRHIETHISWLKEKLVGVGSMDRPTDGALIDQARRFSKVGDPLVS